MKRTVGVILGILVAVGSTGCGCGDGGVSAGGVVSGGGVAGSGGGVAGGGGAPRATGTVALPALPPPDPARSAAGRGQSAGGVGLTVTMPTLAQERPAVEALVGSLRGALADKRVDEALGLFHESTRDSYRKTFAEEPEKLPVLAAALEGATLTFVGDEYGAVTSRLRRGELTVTRDGKVFHVGLVKDGGTWRVVGL